MSGVDKMAWWREAKFGMFIHWGLYAIPGGEWKGRKVKAFPSEWLMCSRQIPDREYSKLARDFNPVKFDAAAWVKIAKSAGMKYLVITAKHHDGFSMYHSKLSPYNIVDATPFRRDPIQELAEACREEGIRFGLYYSQMDWHWSLFPGSLAPVLNFSRYLDFMKGQLEELLTGYGPVSVLFFDGDWIPQWTPSIGRDVEAHCRSLQPDIIINNRVGKRPLLDSLIIRNRPVSTIFPFARNLFGDSAPAGDYDTPEQVLPSEPPARDWETCMTMNTSWGYKHFDNDWKSADKLLDILETVKKGGGNFLLNVGPDSEGLIPEPCVKILAEIGGRMRE